MIKGIFSSEYSSQGKSLAAMGVVGDAYAVGLSIITNSMNTRNFVMTNTFDN
jgi:hypothetical protein